MYDVMATTVLTSLASVFSTMIRKVCALLITPAQYDSASANMRERYWSVVELNLGFMFRS
jgi:hypothetical protein